MDIRTAAVSLLAALGLAAGVARAGTIAPGETRTVEGKVVAVDVAHRAVVVDVPSARGALTVGVTLQEGVQPLRNGKSMSLSDLTVGESAHLTYTRREGKLLGLELRVKRR